MMRLIFLFLCCVGSVFGWQPLPLDAPGYEWMDAQIENEFARFAHSGVTLPMLTATLQKIGSECHRYRIVSSKVYGREGAMKNLLEAIVRCYTIPDVDFLYYAQDVLREEAFKQIPQNAPVFVSAKQRACDRVVLFVDWYYDIDAYHDGWNHSIGAINGNQQTWPWEAKKNTLFWRGANTDGYYTEKTWTEIPRGRIVHLSQHSEKLLIDAAFTKILPWQADKKYEKQMATVPFVPVLDHLPYKYQLLVDGVTCTYPGTQWRLLSGCTTFKQESDDIMWFFSLLEPWVHYIPLRRDFTDVFDKILWARSHDDQAHQIAQNARALALSALMPEHIVLYCAKTLCKYASLQRFAPNIPK